MELDLVSTFIYLVGAISSLLLHLATKGKIGNISKKYMSNSKRTEISRGCLLGAIAFFILFLGKIFHLL